MTTNRVQTKQRQVFLVDDHQILLEGLTGLINHEADLRVCGTATSVAAAVEKLGGLAPHAVVLDLSINGESGLELIEKVHLARPAAVVLVLSMHDETLYAERAIRAGARGYLMKQEGAKHVLGALRQVLRGELCVSPRIQSTILKRVLGDAANDLPQPVQRLTNRELEVFKLIGHGRKTREIAQTLHVSLKTIDTYRERIKNKLDYADGMEMFRNAFEWVRNEEQRHL